MAKAKTTETKELGIFETLRTPDEKLMFISDMPEEGTIKEMILTSKKIIVETNPYDVLIKKEKPPQEKGISETEQLSTTFIIPIKNISYFLIGTNYTKNKRFIDIFTNNVNNSFRYTFHESEYDYLDLFMKTLSDNI